MLQVARPEPMVEDDCRNAYVFERNVQFDNLDGTLLERALDPVERHKRGAHYTPRAYVERLVIPTVIQPLREEWDVVRPAAVTHAREGDRKAAVAELEAFHDRLCNVRVLDPVAVFGVGRSKCANEVAGVDSFRRLTKVAPKSRARGSGQTLVREDLSCCHSSFRSG